MLRILVDAEKPEAGKLAQAGRILRRGGLVAFPTETVYGLGADALNKESVARIYKVKGRPPDNPLIWHANSLEDFNRYVEFNEIAYKLADTFWPGPLTMVLLNRDGLRTAAVRVPSHPVTKRLINASGCIIAAPSANISGRPSPTKAEHVADDFTDDDIDMLIDGGPAHKGLESTVVDLHTGSPRLLRPGAITLEMLRDVLGHVECPEFDNQNGVPLSPGMKYRHYAPKAPLTLLIGPVEAVSAKITEYNGDTGILRTYGKEPEIIAQNLFECLRRFDKAGVSKIVAEGIKEDGIGLAVMNRLKKAAAEVIYL